MPPKKSAAALEKKQDEKRIKEIRAFQRSAPENRRCFDCNEMGPQYVCLDFNTFICTACSGIHREFAHRVKSISMSTFTDTEVTNMIKFGGNIAADRFWRAGFNDDEERRPDPRNRDKVRAFIRKTYSDRRWVYDDSPDEKKPSTLSDEDSDYEYERRKREKAKKKSRARSKKPVVEDHDDDDWGAFGSSRTQQKQASVVKVTEEEDEFADFADFSQADTGSAAVDDFFGEPSKKTDEFGDFADFSTGNAGSSNDQTDDLFAVDFTSSTPSSQPQQQNIFDAFGGSPVKQSAFDDIFGGISSPAPVTQSAVVSDPFGAFNEPTPTNKTTNIFDTPTENSSVAAPPQADPFAAFDTIGESKAAAASGTVPENGDALKPTTSGFDAFDSLGDSNSRRLSSGSLPTAGGFDAFSSLGGASPQPVPTPPPQQQQHPLPPQGMPQGFPGRPQFQQQMPRGSFPPQQHQQPGGFVPRGYPGGFMPGARGPPPPRPPNNNMFQQQPNPGNSQAVDVADPFASLNIGSDFGMKPKTPAAPSPPVVVDTGNPFDMF